MSTKQAIAAAEAKKATPAKAAAKKATAPKAETPEAIDVTTLNRDELVDMARDEAKAKKDAKANGTPVPPTPALDWMNSADYQQRKAANGNKSKGNGTGKATNLTDEQIAEACRELALQGHTTKGAILKQLRGTPRGTRQQRLFPIADRVLTELKKAGKLPEPKAEKATATKKAAKASTKKATAKKAAPAKDASPSELGKQHAAAKARETAKRQVTPRPKASAAKKSA